MKRKRKAKAKEQTKPKRAVATREAAVSDRLNAPLLVAIGLLLTAACVWSYWPNLVEIVSLWAWEPDYSHGYLVLQGLSLIPLVAGVLLTLHGESAWRAMRFPLFMLVFVVPLPHAGIDAITRPLAMLTGDLVIPMLSPFEIQASRAGQVLSVRGLGHDQFHQVIIASECSGIRSLLALLAISSMLACLRGYSATRTWALLLLTPLLVMTANAVRIVITTVMIVYVDPATAESFYHSASGILAVVIALCGLFAVDMLIDRFRAGEKS